VKEKSSFELPLLPGGGDLSKVSAALKSGKRDRGESWVSPGKVARNGAGIGGATTHYSKRGKQS